jgi:hypothetical protein
VEVKKRSPLTVRGLVVASVALAVIGLLAFALIPAIQELLSGPTATPLPPVGLSGDEPAQLAEVVSVPNWNVKVLEVSRGDAAWSAIQSADELNEPPPPGKEYLLVKLWVKSTAADDEAHSISQSDLVVTGDRLVKYYTAEALEPEPELNAELSKGEKTEGWVAFLIDQGEGNLVLILDEVASFREDRFRFIALDEGAAIALAPELDEIQPTELGIDQASPAPLGETVTTEDWQITVREVVRGEQAWQMVQAAEEFNEPPEAGMEYVLVKIQARYIGAIPTGDTIDAIFFQTIGSANVLYDYPSVISPEPALSVDLFPGGKYEGWITMQAVQGETGLMLVFEESLESDQGRRFLSLAE